jgi:hypothetical protein
LLDCGHEHIRERQRVNGALNADYSGWDATRTGGDVLNESQLQSLIVRRLLQEVGPDLGVRELVLPDERLALDGREPVLANGGA